MLRAFDPLSFKLTSRNEPAIACEMREVGQPRLGAPRTGSLNSQAEMRTSTSAHGGPM
jgi:hypothetical protein